MPLVRIDLPATVSTTEAAAASRAVHQALVEVYNVPQDDLFQVVARRAAGEIVCAPSYLGVEHSDKVAFVQVYAAPSRTVGQKEALYARIAAGVATGAGLRPDDVIINLVDTPRENWSFGRGVAHYAVADRQPPAPRSAS
jgi:phenylpyruvate tautomerase PptA (4-oxalocrotonate tautomerase family)